MTNELKNVPELRFPEFDGEWEEKQLNNIVDSLKGNSNDNEELPVLTISAKKGWLNQKERFSQVIAGNSLSKYNELKKGDLSYNKGNSKVALYGIVYKLNYDRALVPNVYKSFRPKSNYEPDFIEKYFHTKILDKQLRKLITSTARMDGLLNISDNDFYSMLINIPTKKEQQKIGEFFSKLDRQIELEEQKLEKLEEEKKGYMQKIFSQELRFKDNNEEEYPDWTIKTLNEVFEVSKKRNKNNEYSHKDVLSVSREHGVINQIKYHGRSYAAKTVENYKIVKPHDLIYTKSPLKGAPYGIFKVTTEEGIISPLYAVYTSLNENITDFVSYYFEFNNIATHYLSKLVSKGAKNTINVTDEMALTGKIILPNSEKEVTQIVNFFNKIRELIKKQRKKIEGLKMRKQGFLQKMFV